MTTQNIHKKKIYSQNDTLTIIQTANTKGQRHTLIDKITHRQPSTDINTLQNTLTLMYTRMQCNQYGLRPVLYKLLKKSDVPSYPRFSNFNE